MTHPLQSEIEACLKTYLHKTDMNRITYGQEDAEGRVTSDNYDNILAQSVKALTTLMISWAASKVPAPKDVISTNLVSNAEQLDWWVKGRDDAITLTLQNIRGSDE